VTALGVYIVDNEKESHNLAFHTFSPQEIASQVYQILVGSHEIQVDPKFIKSILKSKTTFNIIYSGKKNEDFEKFKAVGKELAGQVKFYHTFDSQARHLLGNKAITLTSDVLGRKQTLKYPQGKLNANNLALFVMDHTMGTVTNIEHPYAGRKILYSPKPQLYLTLHGLDPGLKIYKIFYRVASKLKGKVNFFLINSESPIGVHMVKQLGILSSPSIYFGYYRGDSGMEAVEYEGRTNEEDLIDFVESELKLFLDAGDFHHGEPDEPKNRYGFETDDNTDL